jgi:hypothetical protein
MNTYLGVEHKDNCKLYLDCLKNDPQAIAAHVKFINEQIGKRGVETEVICPHCEEKQISLKEVVNIIRARKIEGAKDAIEEAWNMEMERLALQIVEAAYPDERNSVAAP